MLRKDVCPVRHLLLKRFLLHQPEKPTLMWRASSPAVANVLEAVYLSPALKATTVLKCLLGLRNVEEREFLFRKLKDVGFEFALCLVQSFLESMQSYRALGTRL